MPKFREIDESDDDDIEDLEFPFHERPMTLEERDEFIKKYCSVKPSHKSIEERDEILRKSKEKLMTSEEKQSDIDTSTAYLEKTHLKDCGTIQEKPIKMWLPHIRGTHIESERQFMKVIRNDFPGVEKHTNFHKYFQQIGLHIKTINEFDRRKTVTYHELGKFAENINGSSSTIEAWVLQGAKPSIYVLLNEHALSKDEGLALVSGIKEKLKGLDSLEKMDQHLEHPHHKTNTMTIPSFMKDYETARGFYRFIEAIVEGGIINDVASHVGVSGQKARQYTRDHRLPRLIRKVLSTALENTTDFHEIEHIPSEEEFEILLDHHPHLKEIEDFDIMNHEILAYLRLKTMQREGNLPDVTQEELSKIFNIPSARLNLYLSGKSSPRLFQMVGVHERARREYEKKLGTFALEHRIDPTLVFENLKQFNDFHNIPIIEFASSIREIFEKSELSCKIQWIDLKPFTPTGQEWMRKIDDTCVKIRSELEVEVNKQLGIHDTSDKHFRIGVADHKVYLRIQDTLETNWIKLFSGELFYFHNTKTKDRLLSDAKIRLGLKGDTHFSRLVHQLTDYNKSVTKQGINTDLQTDSSHVKGATLGFLLDSCDIGIHKIESEIAFIGRIDRHGIRNPTFSEDHSDIDKTFARIFGAGLSDGHIDKFRVFCYCDASKERIEIFEEYFEFFGDVDSTESFRDGVFELRYPSVIGRALEQRGFPVGDKTVQNTGLPEFILNGTLECITEYVKQLWVEDGHFTWTKDTVLFGWTRAVTLLDPEKDVKYNRESEITFELIDFIHKEGTYYERFCGKIHPHYKISGGKLRRLKRSSDITKVRIADNLLDIIDRTKPQLMTDEQIIMENRGVVTKSTCTEVNHFIGTGRVSALWRARTRGKDDVMRIAILAPPADIQKNKKVRDWIETELDRYTRISNELREKGWVI
ncbi:MAG: hypothetical protein ACTSUO_00095 [Candidatus Thorarchaeota archaeon]